MADFGTTTQSFVGGITPNIKLFGGGFINAIAWLIIIALLLLSMGVGVFFWIRSRRFNKKIVIFEKINGVFQPTGNDRATELKYSTGGDTVFYLLKKRKYIPNPSIQTGNRTYWYFVRSDGEWINFGLEDLDEMSKKVGAQFLDKEMRYARTQIQRGLKERYDKPGFWQQYGLLIFSLAYIALIGIMSWLLFDKFLDVASATNNGVEVAGQVMEQVKQVLGSLDNVCGGSGLR